ncbi:hypothetical protein [Aeromonas cavernicola]|uniref:DUF1496 domain-containing protein n=1 Tax=Aeromonas cavernicola TaxID=1006623 RepID=A0A2H9U2R4_9GAMM|nr:hypothetical protein [Aeromonas cavernicola]PJG58342.1 hypothetical protein CUC53_12950 [Aeromonas cavernicola]
MKRSPLLIALLLATLAHAGPVIISKGDSSINAFALRDQLAREHEWQEWLRLQQALKWLEVLPVNCELTSQQDHSYRCGGQYYRPYRQAGKEIYIQGNPSPSHPTSPQ